VQRAILGAFAHAHKCGRLDEPIGELGDVIGKALLNHRDDDVTAIYARWHMFDEKREAMTAIEAAVLPLMPAPAALAA
jgi:hypothetical protein